jgi:heme exporter protein D
MTLRQRRYMGALTVSTFLAMGAALTAGWVALAFGVGSVAVLVAAGWRRLRQCWREGI